MKTTMLAILSAALTSCATPDGGRRAPTPEETQAAVAAARAALELYRDAKVIIRDEK